MAKPDIDHVSIRPGVSILSVLRHLNYRPWFALAEFVDNSLQSFLENQKALQRLHGKDFALKIDVEFDPTDEARLLIRDNAGGIRLKDFSRAFRPAEVPPDQTGLSEFGMGMKSAACWFSRRWNVRTSSLEEPTERSIAFDVAKIVRDHIEELKVETKKAEPNAHFTEIVLEGLYRAPQGRTLSKIKEHLASIYRVFLREKVLNLCFDGVPVDYEEPKILEAPFYKTPKGKAIRWRKEIHFDFGRGLKISGFAALRETASTSSAGFALFRRNRLIQGSADEGYRPEIIFGKANSYRFQRLFGELHLSGFEVSHTKDGFQWDGNEEPFLLLLKEHLEDENLPLLEQAEGHRVRPKRSDVAAMAAGAAKRTAAVMQQHATDAMKTADAATKADATPLPVKSESVDVLAREVVHQVEWRGVKWEVTIEIADDPGIGDWLTIIGDLAVPKDGKLSIRVALAHPFMQRFVGVDAESLEPILRIATAIALSEIAGRAAGIKLAGNLRRSINELLAKHLSQP